MTRTATASLGPWLVARDDHGAVERAAFPYGARYAALRARA